MQKLNQERQDEANRFKIKQEEALRMLKQEDLARAQETEAAIQIETFQDVRSPLDQKM